ncbi:peptidase S9 [Cellulosimicrobium protaetiae]|uniref:Peptidase S9 n=2 Tax=Cellulosimicrobium protaetiae TaxID=2587808 RepID=A0A6M5UN74_9MICO|nr:peptidase S9 [Cellulosimicrobium protaetiae]
MTVAWYAVPDVVRPRWGRALAKTAVGAAGVALMLTATAEGREARDGVRSLRDAVREVGTPSPDAPVDVPPDDVALGDGPDDVVREDNTYVPDHDDVTLAPPAVLAAGAVGGVALATTLAVAGEKWAYRRGERLRARGVRLPHTRVGLALGALAVALAAAEPLLWNAEDR